MRKRILFLSFLHWCVRAWAIKTSQQHIKKKLVAVAFSFHHFIYRSLFFKWFLSGYCVSRFTNSESTFGLFFLVDFRGFLGQFPYLHGIQFANLVRFLLLLLLIVDAFFCRMPTGRSKWTGSTIFQLFFIDLHLFFLVNWITLRSSSIQDFCLKLEQCKFSLELSNTGKRTAFNMQLWIRCPTWFKYSFRSRFRIPRQTAETWSSQPVSSY